MQVLLALLYSGPIFGTLSQPNGFLVGPHDIYIDI